MEQTTKTISVNTPSSEVLRLECYKTVETYVLPNVYDRRKEPEVTDELMNQIISKAERLYQYISTGKTHSIWHSVKDELLPPYDKDVIVHLTNGTRTTTHRTKKDYSKDCHDFVHITFAEDVDYWTEIPEF